MFAVHFYENNSRVLTQALRNIPSVDEAIKIKGKKGKVINITEIEGNVIHVHIEFEKLIVKNSASSKELGKKKKR